MLDFDLIKKLVFAIHNGEPVLVRDASSNKDFYDDDDDSIEFWIIPEHITVSKDNIMVFDNQGYGRDIKSGWDFSTLGEVTA